MAAKPRDFYHLNPEHTNPARVRQEREKAQALRRTSWWQAQLQKGVCHYCGKKFKATQLTMDHLVPIARGGTSTKGNLVPACAACNRDKKLDTPVDQLFHQLEEERRKKSEDQEEKKKDEE